MEPSSVARNLAKTLLALVTGSGALLRLALSRNWSQVAAGLVGAAFIPSLALALGAATRNEKPFQVLYLVLWYLGPAEGLPVLDFMGVHTEARLGVPAFYLIASLLLFAMAALIRWQQAYNR